MPRRKPFGTRFVDARLIRKLSNPTLTQLAHRKGLLPIVPRGKQTLILQPVKTEAISGLTRDVSNKFTANRVIVHKGTGSVPPEYLGFPNPKVRIRFYHQPLAKSDSHALWGGMTREDASLNFKFSSKLKKAFDFARRSRSPEWELARKYGVIKVPTLEVISTTKPRRTLIHSASNISPQMLFSESPLSPSEKRAARFVLKRSATRPDKKTLVLGTKKGINLALLPQRLVKSQVILNYTVASNLRISNFYTRNGKATAIDILKANGITRANRKWSLNGKRFNSELDAKEFVLNKIAASLGLGVNLMHKLGGTFSLEEEGLWYSSLEMQNVTITGEIVDLDTCQFARTPNPKLGAAKEIDLKTARETITFFGSSFIGPSKFDKQAQLATEKAKQLFDQIIACK